MDNEAARWTTNRGSAKSDLLLEVLIRKGEILEANDQLVRAARVTSKDNTVADWVSRGDWAAAEEWLQQRLGIQNISWVEVGAGVRDLRWLLDK